MLFWRFLSELLQTGYIKIHLQKFDPAQSSCTPSLWSAIGEVLSVVLISEWNRGFGSRSVYLFASRIESGVWQFDFSDRASEGYVFKR